jgi:hypothetical protein
VSIHALGPVHQTVNVALSTTDPFVVARLVTLETALQVASQLQLLVRLNFSGIQRIFRGFFSGSIVAISLIF